MGRTPLRSKSRLWPVPLALLGATALVASACDDSGTQPPAAEGVIEVLVTTHGTHSDTDGYAVLLDNRDSIRVASTGVARFQEVAAGGHAVAITDVRRGCIVDGPMSMYVPVTAGENTLISVRVVCGPGIPTCTTPLPIYGTYDPRAPQYLVLFHDYVDAVAEANRLAALYGFTLRSVWQFALKGFSASLTEEMLEGIRCEASVRYIQHDQVIIVS